MRRPVALGLSLLLALPAAAQEEPPPPPPEDARAGELGYYQRCFGVPRAGPNLWVGVDAQLGPGAFSGPGRAWTPSVSGDDKAWLVLAVLAAMALPVVVYALDGDAPPLVLQRFQCPTFSMEYAGGAETSRTELGNSMQAVSTGRFAFAYSHLATELQYDLAPGAVSAFAAHLVLRPTPRAHIDGGLALGYRRSVFGDWRQEGFEVGLPHRYSFWREGLRSFGLEVRPMLLFSSGVEASLEGALILPLVDVLHLRLGGRVFTFNGAYFWGLQGGLNLTL